MRMIRTSVGGADQRRSSDCLFETWRQIGDQSQEWHPHVIFVALLVRKKPLPLVVELEVLEKSEQSWPEITVLCHGLPRHLRSHLYVRSRYLCKALAVSRRFFLPIMPMRGVKILNTPFGVISSSWTIRVFAPSAVKIKRCPPLKSLKLGTSRTCLLRSNSRSSCWTFPKPLISSSKRVPLPISPFESLRALGVVGFQLGKLETSMTV